jgi:hypothetical protein
MAHAAAQSKAKQGRVGKLGKSIESIVEASLASAVVWLFGLATAIYLLYLFAELWIEPTTRLTALDALELAPANDNWGLTYTGHMGAYLALGEAVAVLVALALSMVFQPWLRRLGLVLCVGWAGLWTTHVVLAAGSQPDLITIGLAGGLIVVTASAIYRLCRLWSQKSRG